MADVNVAEMSHESDIHLKSIDQKPSRMMHKCNKCGYAVTRKDRLNRHIEYEHEGAEWRYKCDKCDQRFKYREPLNDHVRLDHEKSSLKCNAKGCDAEYLTRAGLRNHKYKVHEGKEVFCKECDFRSYNQHKVNIHVREEHLRILNKCELCDFETRLKVTLYAHKKNRHKILPKIHKRKSHLLGEEQAQEVTMLKCDFF